MQFRGKEAQRVNGFRLSHQRNVSSENNAISFYVYQKDAGQLPNANIGEGVQGLRLSSPAEEKMDCFL